MMLLIFFHLTFFFSFSFFSLSFSQSEKFLVFCAGVTTSPELSKLSIRTGSIKSPTILYFLCIPLFEEKHIVEGITSAFQTYHGKDLECDKTELAKAILKASGGVPRIVNYILDSIVRTADPSVTPEILMEVCKKSLVSGRTQEAVVGPLLHSKEDHAIFSTLVMASESKKKKKTIIFPPFLQSLQQQQKNNNNKVSSMFHSILIICFP